MTQKKSSSATIIFAAVGFIISALMMGYLWLIRKVARSVIRPARTDIPEAYIMDVDYESQTITFSASESFSIPGRYGVHFGVDRQGYLKIGAILRQDARGTTRELLEITKGEPKEGMPVWQLSWFYSSAAELDISHREILVQGNIGILPSWFFPKEGSTKWAILVHGRGANRAECLRAVPLLHEQGINCLIMSYRNDGVATPTKRGSYSLGSTEWHDLQSVVEYSLAEGAKSILIMAWSMGAAVTAEYLRNLSSESQRNVISGIIYDSPVVDWQTILDYHADMNHLAEPIRQGAMNLLQSSWGTALIGAETMVDFSEMSLLEHPEYVRQPTLILHSDDDGFVPSSGSRELQALQPELVTLVSFDNAQHVRLWNYDETRWQGAIKAWLQQVI